MDAEAGVGQWSPRSGETAALVVVAVGLAVSMLLLDAAGRDERISAAIWTSPRPQDAELTDAALNLAGEDGVKALKLSFLLGGAADDPDCQEQLDKVFAAARQHDLTVHVHTSPGAASADYATLFDKFHLTSESVAEAARDSIKIAAEIGGTGVPVFARPSGPVGPADNPDAP